MIIGKFKKEHDSYYGKISTMGLNVACTIKPAKRSNEKSPTHRVITKERSGIDIGAGWQQNSQNGNEYVSIKLDCPTLPSPIQANLNEVNGDYLLMWDR